MCRREHRLGLGFGVAQMLPHHVGRQVKACRTAHERFGCEIQRGEMGAEALCQFQPRFQSHLCRLSLVNLNQEVFDRHYPLLIMFFQVSGVIR